jgi:hypothetical protein
LQLTPERIEFMCTVTFIPRPNGYALGMSRDEKLTRVSALPPARYCLGKYDAIFPSEPKGGTWIGVNDARITFALINWYSISARVTGQTVTRGAIVKSALPLDSAELVDETLSHAPISRINPFRLIGIFPAAGAVVEWRWNLRQVERLDFPWQTRMWISSGFDEPGAQQTRSETFRRASRQSSAMTVGWLRRLHRSHAPKRGPYSICMHRDDAATVSYTEIIVSGSVATMAYQSGQPCSEMPVARASLSVRNPSGDGHKKQSREICEEHLVVGPVGIEPTTKRL